MRYRISKHDSIDEVGMCVLEEGLWFGPGRVRYKLWPYASIVLSRGKILTGRQDMYSQDQNLDLHSMT